VLEDDVGDAIFDDDPALRLHPAVLLPQFILGEGVLAELVAGHFVAPGAERALGVLHDVALVHDGHALALALDGVAQGETHQALAGEGADRFDTQAAALEELRAHFLAQEAGQLLVLRRPGLVLDPRVDILGILAEDDHIHVLRLAHWPRHALVVFDRAHAGIQVEHLAQRHVQAAEPAANRSRQRPLDPHRELAQRVEGLCWQVVSTVESRSLLARVNLHPGDLPPATIDLLYGGVPHPPRRGHDVAANPIALNESEDRAIRNAARARETLDLFPVRGDLDMLVRHALGTPHRCMLGRRVCTAAQSPAGSPPISLAQAPR